jgi:hypothetical protein
MEILPINKYLALALVTHSFRKALFKKHKSYETSYTTFSGFNFSSIKS